MIRVTRETEPTILIRKGPTWTAALLNATTREQERKAETKYRNKSIKNALIEMFQGKCAYCESKIVHIDYGHIEHFKPKSLAKFRHLTFTWTNLFLACARCNGPEYKGVRFPEAAEGGPPINPCDDIPEDHLEFVFDSKTRIATVTAKTERGRICEFTDRNLLRSWRCYTNLPRPMMMQEH
jgi:uncharacterized protein (TIGR02646 family)